jgi:glycosyltransferase involved in cell wall biosynthesis
MDGTAKTLSNARRLSRPSSLDAYVAKQGDVHTRFALFAHRLAQADSTGVGRYVRELVGGLAQTVPADTALTIASTPEPGAPTWVPRGVDTVVVGRHRQSLHAAWCLGLGPKIERSLGDQGVVHLLYPFPPAPSHAPQVVTVHDVMPFEHPSWYPRSERLVYRRIMSLALARARRIIVPSAYVASRLAATCDVDPARIIAVHHGISGVFRSTRSAEQVARCCEEFGVQPGRYVVAVGSVSTRKNLVPVISAIAGLREPEWSFLIIGPDGYGASAANTEIERSGAGDRVRRTGFLSDEDVAALVSSAGMLVHPSLEEGFGFVPLEAMAAGTPVIASGTSSIPEVVGQAAILVDQPSEPTAWAEAMSRLMESEQLRRGLVEVGLRHAATFSWRRAAQKTLDVYREAISG